MKELHEKNESKDNQIKWKKDTVYLSDFILTLFVMITTTFCSMVFRRMGFTESNVVMIYILGVVVAARYTNAYKWGIVASVLGVLMFNYFFTEPYYSLSTHSREYPITFSTMLVVAFITSTLTDKIKKEAKESKEKEKYAEQLYKVNLKLLMTRNFEQTKTVIAVSLAELLNRSVVLYTLNDKDKLDDPFVYHTNRDYSEKTFFNNEEKRCALHTIKTKELIVSEKSHLCYIPIIGQEKVLGVVAITDLIVEKMTKEQRALMDAAIVQGALVIEREYIMLKQRNSEMAVQSERLKNNMLHAISHDIRTPLTGIVGSATTLLSHSESLSDPIKKDLLTGIYEEAIWLIHSVENILNITKIDDGRLVIHKSAEVAEELIESVMLQINKWKYTQTIKINIMDTMLLVPVDASLIVHVLYNLIDNALKYSPPNAVITIEVFQEENKCIFGVRDNGLGVASEDLPYIFDKFYRAAVGDRGQRSGMGLGLSICQAIIEVHGGKIIAYNLPQGGAVFRFELPMDEEE